MRGVDIQLPEYEATAADEFELLDLRKYDNCLQATRGAIDQVYNLAADMGGIGYITSSLADIARNNVLINSHMLEASRLNDVRRFLFPPLPASMPAANRRPVTLLHCARKTRIPPIPSRVTVGKNFSARSCAAITGMTSGSKPVLSASTTFTARWALTKAARRKPRRPFRARLLWLPTEMTSRCGGMESKLVPSFMWMIAWKDWCA